MANSTSSAHAICPFYHRTEITVGGKSVVVCEGIAKNCETMIVFRSKSEIMEWMNGKCATYEFAKCPYARLLQDEIDRMPE